MKLFGPEPWGFGFMTPQHQLDRRIETPIDARCLFCDEAIGPQDFGLMMPLIGPDSVSRAYYHRECHLRRIVGSVGHQTKQCSCYGGALDDPPGMTKRQGALAAVELYRRNHRAHQGPTH